MKKKAVRKEHSDEEEEKQVASFKPSKTILYTVDSTNQTSETGEMEAQLSIEPNLYREINTIRQKHE